MPNCVAQSAMRKSSVSAYCAASKRCASDRVSVCSLQAAPFFRITFGANLLTMDAQDGECLKYIIRAGRFAAGRRPARKKP